MVMYLVGEGLRLVVRTPCLRHGIGCALGGESWSTGSLGQHHGAAANEGQPLRKARRELVERGIAESPRFRPLFKVALLHDEPNAVRDVR